MDELIAEAAQAQDIGCRDRQEDAVIAHFCQNDTRGLAVLSDGMGGHDDGDLASRIIAGEMFGELFLSSARRRLVETEATRLFESALSSTNRRLRRLVEAGHLGADTGGTLLSVLIEADALRWISVGDSPLYLFRDGALRRLNEDHSMAPQIDLMVERGEIDAETAGNHPDRACLISAVTGRPIPRVDCPDAAMPLQPDDIVILASDGLNTLEDRAIEDLVRRNRNKDGKTILSLLMGAVRQRQQPQQDNTSLIVIRMVAAKPRSESVIVRVGQDIGQRLAARRQRFIETGLASLGSAARRADP